MSEKHLFEEEIASLTSDECYEYLVGIIKEMTRDELIEFYSVIEAYRAFHGDKDSHTS